MSLWHIAWRYVWSRPLVTVLTLTGVVLGVALICGVLTLRRETERAFVGESGLFDLVVGAKGSPLQLVLSSVYHLDMPTGNIPYSRYEALKKDPRVRIAVPIGLGDNYRGFRIVGTEPEFFSLQKRSVTEEATALFRLREGRWFTNDFEAVVGSQVARQTGLKLGDRFVGVHGLVVVSGSEEHKNFPYTVVGILDSSGTSNDRAAFISLASVWKVHEQEANLHRSLYTPGTPAAAAPPREVTSVLIQLKAIGMRLWMVEEIKKNTEAMAAIPVNEMLRLYQQVLGPLQRTLLGVAYLVVVVSALSILATLYQSAERHRRDLAILRALGGHPREIFFLVLLEAVFLVALGLAAGWLLGHGAVQAAGSLLLKQTGLSLEAWSIDPAEWQALGVVALVGGLAGLVPAALNYRRSPVKDLAAT